MKTQEWKQEQETACSCGRIIMARPGVSVVCSHNDPPFPLPMREPLPERRHDPNPDERDESAWYRPPPYVRTIEPHNAETCRDPACDCFPF